MFYSVGIFRTPGPGDSISRNPTRTTPSSVEVNRWNFSLTLQMVPRWRCKGVCRDPQVRGSTVAVHVKRIRDPHNQVCASFLCFNAISFCSPLLSASSSPAPVLACQPDEGTSALTVPSFLPLSTILHVNAPLNRSEANVLATRFSLGTSGHCSASSAWQELVKGWLHGVQACQLLSVMDGKDISGYSDITGKRPERNCSLLFGNYKIQFILGSKVDPAFLVGSTYFYYHCSLCWDRKMNQLSSFPNSMNADVCFRSHMLEVM